MIFLGIDPGLDGAFAAIGEGGEVEIHDTPSFEVDPGKSSRREYDRGAMADLLFPYWEKRHAVFCILEKAQAMPDQSAQSGFKQGDGWGIWRGILAAYKIPHDCSVTPQKWKAAMLEGLPASAKRSSIIKVQQLFPSAQLVKPNCRVPHDGRAEALLLAAYGRKRHRELQALGSEVLVR
jgi:hypothetical protein